MHKIIVDTNIVWNFKDNNLENLFLPKISDILEFITKNCPGRAKLVFPRIVIQEWLEKRLRRINEIVSNITLDTEKLSTFFDITFNDADYRTFNYREYYEKKIKDILETNNLEILETPLLDQKKIIEKAIFIQPPFEIGRKERGKKATDCGFKDNILWETILNDMKNNPQDKYCLLSEDEIFTNESLKEELKKLKLHELTVCVDGEGVQEYLDEELGLNLDVEAINTSIKKITEKNIGDVMVELHRRNYILGGILRNKKRVASFNIKNIFFNKIKGSEDVFEAYLTLKLNAHTIQEKKGYHETDNLLGISPLDSLTHTFSLTPRFTANGVTKDTEEVSVSVRVYYDRSKDYLAIGEIDPEYPLAEESESQLFYTR